MVAIIYLQYSSPPNFKLNERAENVEINELNGVKYTKYELSNIYKPKIRFSFCNEVSADGARFFVKIRKIKKLK
ncbi:unnamed protein product [Meloidogyne enterolobii]|uniref:Uncharacterized protein n=1 Tax=Meloidogyne enterolobii TaxID=390850 RepID=A0ACB0ZCB1_MELEN